MSVWKYWCAAILLPTVGMTAPRVVLAEVSEAEEGSAAPVETLASARIVERLDPRPLRDLALEVLERSPEVAATSARARAAARRAPQMASLPDPVASLTAFLATPETRTGPQRLSLGVSQAFPWAGKRALREEAAALEASALDAEVEATRLGLVTDVRRLYHELAFLARSEQITNEFRAHLRQHEEVARARYSTGVGLGQGVVKLQAELTRVEKELLDIETRRIPMESRLNALRDSQGTAELPEAVLADPAELAPDADRLVSAALRLRPEIHAADARIAAAESLIRVAEKGYRPDLSVGLTYTVVDPRDDLPATVQPPPGSGDDIVGIRGGVTLPVWRDRIEAAVDEAIERQTAARESKRRVVARVRAAIRDWVPRLELSWKRLRLLEDLLLVQAEESLRSAQSGYVTGTLNALDLLDAEHVLFETRTAIARAKADSLIAFAELEGAIGAPLEDVSTFDGGEQ